MKRHLRFSLRGLVMVFCLGLLANMASAQVTPPPDGWLPCTGVVQCYTHAHWTGLGVPVPAQWDCDYTTCSGNCETWRDSALVEKTGTTIKITVKNLYVSENVKHVRFRIAGTGATDVPNTLVIQGLNNTPPNSFVAIQGAPVLTNTGGSWVVDVKAEISPQPDKVTLTVVVPGTPVVTLAWADECCQLRPVPTLSEWGLIIFSLLILTLGTVVVVRRKQSLAIAGEVSGSIKAPLLDAGVFWKVLASTEALAVVGLGIAGAVYGSLALRDIIGTVISAGIVAYMAHLWIGPRRE